MKRCRSALRQIEIWSFIASTIEENCVPWWWWWAVGGGWWAPEKCKYCTKDSNWMYKKWVWIRNMFWDAKHGCNSLHCPVRHPVWNLRDCEVPELWNTRANLNWEVTSLEKRFANANLVLLFNRYSQDAEKIEALVLSSLLLYSLTGYSCGRPSAPVIILLKRLGLGW